MANTFYLTADTNGGVRNGLFTIDTTNTIVAGAGDIYTDIFSTAQNASGVGTVSVILNVVSTASATLYATNSPMANILAGTAVWYAPGSAVTGQTKGIGTNYTITGPITALTVAVGTNLAGIQAYISIHAGYPAGKPATY